MLPFLPSPLSSLVSPSPFPPPPFFPSHYWVGIQAEWHQAVLNHWSQWSTQCQPGNSPALCGCARQGLGVGDVRGSPLFCSLPLRHNQTSGLSASSVRNTIIKRSHLNFEFHMDSKFERSLDFTQMQPPGATPSSALCCFFSSTLLFFFHKIVQFINILFAYFFLCHLAYRIVWFMNSGIFLFLSCSSLFPSGKLNE